MKTLEQFWQRIPERVKIVTASMFVFAVLGTLLSTGNAGAIISATILGAGIGSIWPGKADYDLIERGIRIKNP